MSLNDLNTYLHQIRIHHWIKNLLVFVPAFFTFQVSKIFIDIQLSSLFFCFCFTASFIYIINDLFDLPTDQLIPNTQNRPYAKGEVSKKEMGFLLMILVLLILVSVSITLIFIPIAVYLISNFLYSFFLKRIPVIDVLMICLGFECRIWAGAIAVHVKLSGWLMIMVFLLALFLILAKRRTDVYEFEKSNMPSRGNTYFYSKLPLNQILYGLAFIILVCYIAYCFSDEVINRMGDKIYITSFLVMMGLSRYLYLIFYKKISLYPADIIVKDRPLQIIFAGWIVSLYLLIYK